jgi:hypothetical protein
LAAQIKITGCANTLRASVSPSPTNTPLNTLIAANPINNHVFHAWKCCGYRKKSDGKSELLEIIGHNWLLITGSIVGQPGKLGETRKVFKVKSTKSARNVEINHSRIAESASRAALLGCKMLIAETIKGAFHTLQALVEEIIRARSSIETLNLIIVAQFALILSISP